MIGESEQDRIEGAIRRLRSSGWTIVTEREISDGRPTLSIPAEIDDYFDDRGFLVRDLPFRWTRGMTSRIQSGFARFGLCALLDLGADEGDGRVLAARSGQSDLCRIVKAFATLEGLGYIAEPDFSYTSSSGWSDVHGRQGENAQAVFWNSQAHLDCFNDEGMLIDDLALQWSGDSETIAAALRETGLVIEIPEVPGMVFYVCPEGEGAE
ncbi:hypothetical protein AB0C52_23975 [Streptomyces sp. NPDC048717]|uniref:hypothetical protein n=1 Tax=Streptomyces sp. NPDC048717 TaxID=3154928 RepID=UPI00342AF2B5